MYGVRILQVHDRVKAKDWELFDVADGIKKDVEKHAPVVLGYAHNKYLKEKNHRAFWSFIPSFRELDDDDTDALIMQALEMGAVLSVQPKCKLNEMINKRKDRKLLGDNCIDDARRIAVCAVFENGKDSKKFTFSRG
jgi:hypothetical protein